MTPGAYDVSRPRSRGREATERLLPLVAPHLEVDVDDVVVANRQAGEAVADRERARLSRRLESPDDANPPTEVADAERPGGAARLEVGRGAGTVCASVLGDADIRDALTAAIGDLAKAVRESEVAAERDGDAFLDRDTPVCLDPSLDVGLDELVRLGKGRRCDCECDERRGRNR